MKSNHFTIVIPTRERADTLFYSLKTCVDQDYENLTILVSDNNSMDNTREVVSSFKDSRIKYVNTGERVQMSQNWEFALNHVDNGFVTYIGDDDGFLINCIDEINRLFCDLHVSSIAWGKIEYCWPDHIVDHHKNVLRMSLSTRGYFYDGRKKLKKLRSFSIGYNDLPCLYNSFIDVNLIKKIKQNSKNAFFRSITPDIYTGIILSSVMGEYIYSKKPFSINGASRHSTGTSQMLPHVNLEPSQKFSSEITTSKLDEKLVVCPSTLIYVADSFLKAQQTIPSQKNDFAFNMNLLLYKLMQEAVGGPYERYKIVKKAVYKMCEINNLNSFAKKIDKIFINKPLTEDIRYGLDLTHNLMTLNASIFGVTNVYDASRLCSHILQNNKLDLDEKVSTVLKRNFRKIFCLKSNR